MNVKITFESLNGPATIPLEQATFEQIAQVHKHCQDLMAQLDMEALQIA